MPMPVHSRVYKVRFETEPRGKSRFREAAKRMRMHFESRPRPQR